MAEEALQDAVIDIQSKVLRARKLRGWSQKELGEHVHASEAEVSRALSGTVTPAMTKLRQKIFIILEIE